MDKMDCDDKTNLQRYLKYYLSNITIFFSTDKIIISAEENKYCLKSK